jgi:hypothetical protein
MAMIMYITRAIAWGLSRVFRVAEQVPVAHLELEHAHWDPTRREWFIHADAPESTVARAA